MIHYLLKCNEDHRFEGWFRNSATFERQAAAGEIACPVCGSAAIERAPMAPRLGKGIKEPAEAAPAPAAAPAAPAPAVPAELQQREALRMLRRLVETHFEDLGNGFAGEVRRIHDGEAPHRAIYGNATEAEVEELAEDGIEIARIPWISSTDS